MGMETFMSSQQDNTNRNQGDDMSTLIATNIKWDVDEGDDVKLPESMPIPAGMTDEDEISDYLSDETGYCHGGFSLEKVKTTKSKNKNK